MKPLKPLVPGDFALWVDDVLRCAKCAAQGEVELFIHGSMAGTGVAAGCY